MPSVSEIVRWPFHQAFAGLQGVLTWAVYHPVIGLVTVASLWLLAKLAGIYLSLIWPRKVPR